MIYVEEPVMESFEIVSHYLVISFAIAALCKINGCSHKT